MSEFITPDQLEGLPSGTEVDLELMPIIFRIPKDTANMNIKCSIFDHSGKVHEVCLNLNASAIHEAREDFNDLVGDDDYDAVYTLTDEGRAYLEELVKKQGGLV